MKVLVVVPTYNERENIRELIPEIFKNAPSVDVLIVDDNSPDGTAEVVEEFRKVYKGLYLLKRPGKMGLGSAYVEAFKWALGKSYDCVIEMDADFSHNPEDLPRLIANIKSSDIVLGSRYLNGVSVVNWPITRLFLSYFANKFASFVTGVPIKDLTGGFKCIRKEVLKEIDLDRIKSDGYAFQIELTVKAWYRGFKIKEIPIIFIERRSGQSKMSKRIVWEAFWMVWRLRLENLFKRRKKAVKS